MEQKYFLHRIQEGSGGFSKGIEIHDTLDAATLAFWGRMKLAYGGNADITFVSCKITDTNGNVISPYDLTWNADPEFENRFFMHHITLDGSTFRKDIDVYATYDAARSAYAAAMEYGYNNVRQPNVTYVSCEITDRSGSVMDPFKETWIKPEPEPEEVESAE